MYTDKISRFTVTGPYHSAIIEARVNRRYFTRVLMSLLPNKNIEHLQVMDKACKDLNHYFDHINSIGGLRRLAARDQHHMFEHSICDCINRLGDRIKIQDLSFDKELQSGWSKLRIIAVHQPQKLDLQRMWDDNIPTETKNLLVLIEKKLNVTAGPSASHQDGLVAYFKKSVRLYTDYFEYDVVRPALASSHMFFKEKPITAVRSI